MYASGARPRYRSFGCLYIYIFPTSFLRFLFVNALSKSRLHQLHFLLTLVHSNQALTMAEAEAQQLLMREFLSVASVVVRLAALPARGLLLFD